MLNKKQILEKILFILVLGLTPKWVFADFCVTEGNPQRLELSRASEFISEGSTISSLKVIKTTNLNKDDFSNFNIIAEDYRDPFYQKIEISCNNLQVSTTALIYAKAKKRFELQNLKKYTNLYDWENGNERITNLVFPYVFVVKDSIKFSPSDFFLASQNLTGFNNYFGVLVRRDSIKTPSGLWNPDSILTIKYFHPDSAILLSSISNSWKNLVNSSTKRYFYKMQIIKLQYDTTGPVAIRPLQALQNGKVFVRQVGPWVYIEAGDNFTRKSPAILYDMMGNKVATLTQTDSGYKWNGQFGNTPGSNGVYFVQLEGKIVGKFIYKKKGL